MAECSQLVQIQKDPANTDMLFDESGIGTLWVTHNISGGFFRVYFDISLVVNPVVIDDVSWFTLNNTSSEVRCESFQANTGATRTATITVTGDNIATSHIYQIKQLTDVVVLNQISLSISYSSSGDSCGMPVPNTLYTDSINFPTNGDIIYTDVGGTNVFVGSAGWYTEGVDSFRVSTIGVVSNFTICL